jgi:lipopolysaccharide transport protein LptA
MVRKIVSIVFAFASLSYAEQVEVTSREMQAFEKRNEIRFIGDANVTKGKSWIHADMIVVYMTKEHTVRKYVASGEATFSLVKNEGAYSGRAERIEYDPLRSVYILSGGAVVSDSVNKRLIRGEKILLDMRTGRAEAKSGLDAKGHGKPVKFIFETEGKK